MSIHRQISVRICEEVQVIRGNAPCVIVVRILSIIRQVRKVRSRSRCPTIPIVQKYLPLKNAQLVARLGHRFEDANVLSGNLQANGSAEN